MASALPACSSLSGAALVQGATDRSFKAELAQIGNRKSTEHAKERGEYHGKSMREVYDRVANKARQGDKQGYEKLEMLQRAGWMQLWQG